MRTGPNLFPPFSKMGFSPTDYRFMDAALAQGYSGLGTTAPNPAVGCVLAKDDRIIAAAVTGPGGRPHAERLALDAAGDQARGATAYVTLEPCSHYGQTPPCAEALIEAEIARVVIACLDPFPEVNGSGALRLEQAGIAVATGLRQAEAEALHAGFFTFLKTGKPLLKSDPRQSLFDADLVLQPGESEEEGLVRLGKAGLTRVRKTPD